MTEPRILQLIVHDMELWTRPAPPIAQPETGTQPTADSHQSAIAAKSVISMRRAQCATCEHLAKPDQCGCDAGLCNHPQANNPNITALTYAECQAGIWE